MGHVSFPVEDAQNSERPDASCVDDQIGENFIEENGSGSEIGPPMADVWQAGQPVKDFEEIGDRFVGSVQSILVQLIEPYCVEIENRVLS